MRKKIIAEDEKEFKEIKEVSKIFEKEVLLNSNPLDGHSMEYMEFLFRIDSVETFDNPIGEGEIKFTTIEVIPPKNEQFHEISIVETVDTDESVASIVEIGADYVEIRLSNNQKIILKNLFGLIEQQTK